MYAGAQRRVISGMLENSQRSLGVVHPLSSSGVAGGSLFSSCRVVPSDPGHEPEEFVVMSPREMCSLILLIPLLE